MILTFIWKQYLTQNHSCDPWLCDVAYLNEKKIFMCHHFENVTVNWCTKNCKTYEITFLLIITEKKCFFFFFYLSVIQSRHMFEDQMKNRSVCSFIFICLSVWWTCARPVNFELWPLRWQSRVKERTLFEGWHLQGKTEGQKKLLRAKERKGLT